MSRARHGKMCKADGGSVYYEGAGSKVAKEAAEKRQPMKKGGAVKEMGKVSGEKGKRRMDRRARGGGVGSDRSPFAPAAATKPYSSAAK